MKIMYLKNGQTVLEYSLLAAISIVALIAAGSFMTKLVRQESSLGANDGGAFRKHFDKASEYMRNVGNK